MKPLTLWHVMIGLVLIVTLVSLWPGVPGLREMAAEVHAGWLLDRAVEHLNQQQLAEEAAILQPGPRAPVGQQHRVQAETMLKQALACRPTHPALRDQLVGRLVQALMGQKKWIECAALIEVSLSQGVSPEVPLRLDLASCYDALQEYSRSERIYENLRQRFPKDATINNNLAYHYAQRGIRLDWALELVKQALLQEPSSGPFLDTLGWIYYRKGWLRQAEMELVRAQRLTPLLGSAEVLYHLGVVYAEQGRNAEAIQSLLQALRIEPDFSPAQELLKKIQRRPRLSSDFTV